MSDSVRHDDDKRFAVELEKELDGLVRRKQFKHEFDSPAREEHIDERIQKARPALDLLAEFSDRPDLLVSESAMETGPAGATSPANPTRTVWYRI